MSNHTPSTIYVDTIESITSSSGIIKLNLVRTKEAVKEGEEAQILSAGQLIMPLAGFLYAMSIMQSFGQSKEVQELISKYQELGFVPSTSQGNGG